MKLIVLRVVQPLEPGRNHVFLKNTDDFWSLMQRWLEKENAMKIDILMVVETRRSCSQGWRLGAMTSNLNDHNGAADIVSTIYIVRAILSLLRSSRHRQHRLATASTCCDGSGLSPDILHQSKLNHLPVAAPPFQEEPTYSSQAASPCGGINML